MYSCPIALQMDGLTDYLAVASVVVCTTHQKGTRGIEAGRRKGCCRLDQESCILSICRYPIEIMRFITSILLMPCSEISEKGRDLLSYFAYLL